MNDPARILVVDDNEINRDILVTRLEAHGYKMLQAADGEEALACLAQHRPDLVLLDVMMPKLDGFEVCRRVRRDTSLPFIPIIMVTARAPFRRRDCGPRSRRRRIFDQADRSTGSGGPGALGAADQGAA